MVICRIGSLEIDRQRAGVFAFVICRIGSLENDDDEMSSIFHCYLPYRQLRKWANEIEYASA